VRYNECISFPPLKCQKSSAKKSKFESSLKKLISKKNNRLLQLAKHKSQLQEIKDTIKDFFKGGIQRNLTDVLEEGFEKNVKAALAMVEQAMKVKGLSKQHKQILTDVKEQLHEDLEQMRGFVNNQLEDFSSMMNSKFDQSLEGLKNLSSHDELPTIDKALNEFSVDASDEEKKNIRALYLELVKQFHPDKCTSKEEKNKYHELTQKANSAHQMNDYEALINLKESCVSDNLNPLIDDLSALEAQQEKEVFLLEREISVIESQILRVKTEINKLKKSELGGIYKEARQSSKLRKDGIKQYSQEFAKLIDGLQVFIDGGPFPEELFQEVERYEEDDLLAHISEAELEEMVARLLEMRDEKERVNSRRGR